jgi:hypothetical protein
VCLVRQYVLESPECVFVARLCSDEYFVKGTYVNPIAGLGSLGECESPPGAECETESSTEECVHDGVEYLWPIEIGVAERFGNVLRDILSEGTLVTDEANVEDHRVPGDIPPRPTKVSLGNVGTLKESVNVNVPRIVT